MVMPWTVTLCPLCRAAVSVPPDPVMIPLVAALDRTLVFAGAVRGMASAATQAHVNTVLVLCIYFNLAQVNLKRGMAPAFGNGVDGNGNLDRCKWRLQCGDGRGLPDAGRGERGRRRGPGHSWRK